MFVIGRPRRLLLVELDALVLPGCTFIFSYLSKHTVSLDSPSPQFKEGSLYTRRIRVLIISYARVCVCVVCACYKD